MNDIPKLLRAIAAGTQAQANKHDVIFLAAAAEIERLQEAKRAALAIADERSKENVGLQALVTDLANGLDNALMSDEIERLRAGLETAKTEIEWWVSEHGCCDGHEDEAMQQINVALAAEQRSK